MQEVQDRVAGVIVGGQLGHLDPIARSGQRDRQILADGGGRAVGHHHHAIGQQHSFVDIMGDHHHGGVKLRLDLHHRILEAGAGECVERAERLVHQQHAGLHRNGAGDADALLHAARNLAGPLGRGMGHVDQLEIVVHPLLALCPALAGHCLVDGEANILFNRQPGQQRVILKDHGAIRTRLVDGLAIEEHHAAGGLRQARDDIEQSRFAAPGVPDQRDELPLLDRKIDILDRRERPSLGREDDADAFEREIAANFHVPSPQAREMRRPMKATSLSSAKPVMPIQTSATIVSVSSELL